LIAALKKLIDQPDLRKTMGIAGRKLVEKEFNLKTQSKMYADLYRRLLKEAGALA
jgi:glycosyltransferase involved in cell wall biosynthesis